MCIFDTSSRETLKAGLIAALHVVDEPEMIAVIGSALEKLDTVTDTEFAEIGFYIADDDNEANEGFDGVMDENMAASVSDKA